MQETKQQHCTTIHSCDVMCTDYIIHPCGILPLAQARPKMPCIYTSLNVSGYVRAAISRANRYQALPLLFWERGYFFPHPRLAWRRQIGPMLSKRPWHAHSVVTCYSVIYQMAANSAKDRVFQQFSVLSSEQSAKGVACEISEKSESRKQWHNRQKG